MTIDPDRIDQPQTDQGVPVGDADVEQDRLNADPDADSDADDDTWAAPGTAEQQTDQGVPVGDADLEADRRNTTEPDESAI